MRLIIILLLLLVYATKAYTQTFVAESKLSEIPKSGFYKIELDPSVMTYANADFSNLRVLNSTNKESPFITGVESPIFSHPQFEEYKIYSKKITPNCCSQLILENTERKPINNISILIKNADVYKQANLLGSDDLLTWYALKENFFLNSVNNPDETYEIRILNFPLSNYQYLSLNLNDSISSPLNILKAGYYKGGDEIYYPDFLKVPGLIFTASDSVKQKKTYVSIQFDTARLVDKLELNITGLPFYHRQATLYSRTRIKNSKGKLEWQNSFVQHIDLTSTHASTIMLDGERYRWLILEIENNDNQPLQFKSIEAYQVSRFLIAWLEQGVQYSLKIGDDLMNAPNYDIAYFKDKVPVKPPLLKISALRSLNQIEPQKEKVDFFKNNLFIWTVIILVALLLVYMSIRMIRETNQKVQS